jgi:hypothetical protein
MIHQVITAASDTVRRMQTASGFKADACGKWSGVPQPPDNLPLN